MASYLTELTYTVLFFIVIHVKLRQSLLLETSFLYQFVVYNVNEFSLIFFNFFDLCLLQ